MKRIMMIMMIGAVLIFANTEMMSIDRSLELKERELKNYTRYDLINRSLELKERELKNTHRIHKKIIK